MISDVTATQTPTTRPPTPLAGMLAIADRLKSAIRSYVNAPVQPHAALLEANVVLSLLRHKQEYVEPDPFATEMPFLSDSWPRG